MHNAWLQEELQQEARLLFASLATPVMKASMSVLSCDHSCQPERIVSARLNPSRLSLVAAACMRSTHMLLSVPMHSSLTGEVSEGLSCRLVILRVKRVSMNNESVSFTVVINHSSRLVASTVSIRSTSKSKMFQSVPKSKKPR